MTQFLPNEESLLPTREEILGFFIHDKDLLQAANTHEEVAVLLQSVASIGEEEIENDHASKRWNSFEEAKEVAIKITPNPGTINEEDSNHPHRVPEIHFLRKTRKGTQVAVSIAPNLEGKSTLRDLIYIKYFPVAQLLSVVRDAMLGAHDYHMRKKEKVHGDVKPGNIIAYTKEKVDIVRGIGPVGLLADTLYAVTKGHEIPIINTPEFDEYCFYDHSPKEYPYEPANDVFSFGITLLECVMRNKNFATAMNDIQKKCRGETIEVRQSIIFSSIEKLIQGSPFPENIRSHIKTLIQSMVQFDRSARPPLHLVISQLQYLIAKI